MLISPFCNSANVAQQSKTPNAMKQHNPFDYTRKNLAFILHIFKCRY